jgi:hypothetical protein
MFSRNIAGCSLPQCQADEASRWQLREEIQMIRLMGIVYAAIAAIVIATAPMTSAQAAPVFAGSGSIVRDAVPNATETVQWGRRRGGGFRGGGRGFRGGGFRGNRGGFNRGFRPARAYYGPRYRRGYRAPIYYGAPVYYGRRCWIRPAKWVLTPFGYQLRRARRVCR